MPFSKFGNKYLQLCGEKREGLSWHRLRSSYTLHRIQQIGMVKNRRRLWKDILRKTPGTYHTKAFHRMITVCLSRDTYPDDEGIPYHMASHHKRHCLHTSFYKNLKSHIPQNIFCYSGTYLGGSCNELPNH